MIVHVLLVKTFSPQEGFSGFACHECDKPNFYGEKCDKGILLSLLTSARKTFQKFKESLNEHPAAISLCCLCFRSAECDCKNGACNDGPDGDGQCLCQPPYSGKSCDQGKMPELTVFACVYGSLYYGTEEFIILQPGSARPRYSPLPLTNLFIFPGHMSLHVYLFVLHTCCFL